MVHTKTRPSHVTTPRIAQCPRSGECVGRHLAGVGGARQLGTYADYNRLQGAGADVTLTACFAEQEAILRAAWERELAPFDARR
jgi:hypothetical protein